MLNLPNEESGRGVVRQRRKDARPGELVAAALALFVERGFAATRLDDVAARAGVSKGTLYLYFDSKEALFKAVIQQGLVPVLDQVDELVARFEAGSSSELLTEMMIFWWRMVGQTALGGIPKLLISEARNFPETAAFYHQVVVRRGHEMVARVLERGIASKEFRTVDIDATVELLFAPILMLVVWRHSFGACESQCAHPFQQPEQFLRAHADLALRGLTPREST
jgi:AcrR family transcriptional regulator